MGVCYKLILEDEFDWGYSDTSKEERLKEFETKFGRYIEREAGWYGYVVYDIDKASPFTEERKLLIREYADRAYYISDLGSGITELDLPVHTQTVQAEIDRMATRRTPEAIKVAEDYIRQKLEKMNGRRTY